MRQATCKQPDRDDQRHGRGGGWDDEIDDILNLFAVSGRYCYMPTTGVVFVGFRVARSKR
jgi:hypothetical protein